MTDYLEPPADAIDIGHDHFIRFANWEPDRSILANAELYANVPDLKPCGVTIWHKRRSGKSSSPNNWCCGHVNFDLPNNPFKGHVWQVHSLDPLDLSPSILCKAPDEQGIVCGDHGFIKQGRWVVA